MVVSRAYFLQLFTEEISRCCDRLAQFTHLLDQVVHTLNDDADTDEIEGYLVTSSLFTVVHLFFPSVRRLVALRF